MWKNWIPFRRKEEDNADSTARSATSVLSNGKENTLKSQHEGNVGRREYGHGAGNFRTETKNYPNVSIGNLNVSTSNLSSEGMLSVLNASGPLLSSPLLPKIKRAVELNQSLREYSISSPLRRSSIKRPISPSYGPTHPTQSNPGRFPVVRLEKRPSLLDIRSRSLLSPGRRLLSPSTVKVAPPDPRMLSSPRMSPVQTPSAAKNVVDTQMVVAALRERRKRSNLHVDENVLEESIMQTAKRRRQDSSQAVTSTASMPIMADVLTDMSQETNSFNSLLHMEKMALKRSPVLGNELQETAVEMPTPKLSQKESRSSILSSLSSSKRAAQNKTTAVKEFPQGKCVNSQILLQSETNHDENKKQSLVFPCSTEKVISSRIPVSSAGFFESINFTHVADKNVNKSPSKTDRMASVEKSLDLNAQLNRRRAINIYPSLKTSPGKSMIIATPADFESDRREEDARRVQDVLAYLDGNEQGQAETSKPSAVLANFTSSSDFPGKGIITPNTTASSLTELLSSSGNTTQTFATITTTPSLNTLAPEVTSHVTITSLSFLAPTLTLVTSDALSKNTAGLVQSSGVSASTSLIQSTPICSTGISSLPGSQGKPAGGTPLVLGIPSTSTVGVASSSAALATVLTTSASAATSSIASTSPDKRAFTFNPLFGDMQMPPVSINNFHPTASMSEPFIRGSSNLVASPSPNASTTSSSSSVVSTASASVTSTGVFSGVSTSTTVISGTSQAVSSGERGGIPQTLATRSSSGGFSFEAASTTNTSATTNARGFFIGSSDIQLQNLAPSTGGFTFGETAEQVALTSTLSGPDMNTLSGKSLQPKNLFGASKENEGKSQPAFNSISGFGRFGSPGTQPGLPSNSQGLTGSSQASITTTTNSTLSFGSPVSETPFGVNAASTVNNIFQQRNSAVNPQGGIFGTPASTAFSFGTTSSKNTFTLGAHAANTSATAGTPSFGSAASAVTTTSSTPATSLFAFGQTPVTTVAAVTSAPASTFVFGQAQAATKVITSATPNNSLFACGQAPAMPIATNSTTSTGGLFAFGQTPATTTTNTIAPANGLFTFGQTQTSSTATNNAALTNGPFTFGKTPGTTTAANTQPPAGGLFTFGQIPAASSSTQPTASNLFTFGQMSAVTTTNTQAPPNSLFTFSQAAFSTTTSNITASGNSFAFGQKPESTAVTTTAKNLFTLGQAPPTTSINTFQFGPGAATASNQPFAFGAAGTTNSGNTFTFGTSTNASGSSGFSFGASGPTTTGSSTFNFGTSSVGMGGFGASAQQQQPLQNTFGGNSSFSLGSAQPQQGFNFGNSASAGFAFGSVSNTAQVPAFGSSPAPSTVQSGQTFGSTSSVPAFGGSHSQTVAPVFGMSGSQSAAGASTTSGSAPFAFGATGGNAQQSSAPFAFGSSVSQSTGANTGFQFGQPSTGSATTTAFNFSASGPQFNFGGPASQGSTMFTTGAGSTAAKPRANAMKARRRTTRK